MPTIPLQLRRRPAQARSRETFERILRVAADLLDEVGWEGFNTNLLAQRAGLGVQAVYRYFPNKLAVIYTLAERMVAEWNLWLSDFEQTVEGESDWGPVWRRYIDRFTEGVRRLPGGAAVRSAMAASPVLRALDQRDNAELARRMAKSLRKRAPGLSPARARDCARALIETAVAVIDLALASPPATSRRLLDELKTMQVAYLERLFDEEEAP